MFVLILIIFFAFCLALILLKTSCVAWSPRKQARLPLAIFSLFFFGGTIGVYVLLGSPFTKARPFEAFLQKNPALMDRQEQRVFLEASFARHPANGKLAQQLAVLYLQNGDALRALTTYQQALRLEGEKAALYVGYGLALMAYNKGKITLDAQKLFEKAAGLVPEDIYPRLFIAQAFVQKKQASRAALYLRKFLTAFPNLAKRDKEKLSQFIAHCEEGF